MAPFGEFNGWNKLSFLPDRWHPPWSTPTNPGEARARYAFARCWIGIDEIVSRLERTRSEHGGDLNTVFISTNGDQKWIDDVRAALKGPRGVGWKVVTSRDLKLDWQQQGVDMAIGAFLLFGFGSLRRVRLASRRGGVDAISSAFWWQIWNLPQEGMFSLATASAPYLPQ